MPAKLHGSIAKDPALQVRPRVPWDSAAAAALPDERDLSPVEPASTTSMEVTEDVMHTCVHR